MKRSELLDKLKIELYGWDVHSSRAAEVCAETVLAIVENSGMLPPAYNQNEGSGPFGIASWYVNEWEPEDQK